LFPPAALQRPVRFSEYVESELAQLEGEGLLRSRSSVPDTSGLLDVCTNDYLGYARRHVSRETTGRSGSGASRLIFGTQPEHAALETELASWVGAEDALLFSSGYAANLGALAALAGPGDLVVSDRLNHASIVDGCRLSRANVQVVPHCDLEATDQALKVSSARRRWVVTETYFSMDGDSPDLSRLRALCDARGAALVVDEAHALGIFGPEGGGLCRRAGVVPDVLVGGLGKSVGLQGGFVAGVSGLTRLLWNRARSFVFSTAPSPRLAAVALDHVRAIRSDDGARARLAELSVLLDTALAPLHSRLPVGRYGPIFPVLLGSPERAQAVAARLRDCGFLVQAIRPPTVPSGGSRLRVALHADLDAHEVHRLAAALLELCLSS
jgi:8-amino-7-oxononanoate synthase